MLHDVQPGQDPMPKGISIEDTFVSPIIQRPLFDDETLGFLGGHPTLEDGDLTKELRQESGAPTEPRSDTHSEMPLKRAKQKPAGQRQSV